MEGQEDRVPSVQLRDTNVALLAAYRNIMAPRVHAGRPAHLGHDPRERLPAFFVQVSSTDVLTMSVPPAMELPLIKKYKMKKEGPHVKTPLFLG
jgi:hypothetical protein